MLFRSLDRGDRDEIADLRASLQSVTMREKERLEALQSQLEAARHELSECRSGRRIEQSNLVAAESQATQLRTALACAEEDMKALRDALDQELLRGHRLQSRLMELDHTLHSHSLRGQFEDDPKSRAHAAPGKSRAGADSTAAAPSLEDVAFDDYLSSLRKDGGGGGGRGGRGKSRPGSAKLGKGGGARAAGDRQRPVSAGGNARAQKDDGMYGGAAMVTAGRQVAVGIEEVARWTWSSPTGRHMCLLTHCARMIGPSASRPSLQIGRASCRERV